MRDSRTELTTTIDPVDEALLRAEAKARGVPYQQVLDEKVAQGLDRIAGSFAGPDRPSKTPKH